MSAAAATVAGTRVMARPGSLAGRGRAGAIAGGRSWRKNRGAVCAALLFVAPAAAEGTDVWFDRLADSLTVGSADGSFRARLSGTLDLEGYAFSQPAPGLIGSPGEALFSPRLTAFLDAQLGERVYAFLQFRADRGFDPGRRHVRGRLDEYAVRISPWNDGRFNVQVGRFGTVIGNWVPRHGSWDNPFITAPLAYEHLTGMWDSAPAPDVETLLDWAHVRPRRPAGAPATDKFLRLPVIWGPSYTTGVAVSGRIGRMTYAVEVKDASLSSRPRVWKIDNFEWRSPTVGGRLGFRPNAMWDVGVSASRGTYLEPAAANTLPPGRRLGDYDEIVFAQDIGFAWHHVQVWAEFFEARFTIPGVADAETFAYYVEAKYKFTPQLAGAVRWNEQLFSRIPDGSGGHVRWGANVRRLDLGPIYRLSAHAQLKLQYSLEHREGEAREFGHVSAVQFTVRF